MVSRDDSPFQVKQVSTLGLFLISLNTYPLPFFGWPARSVTIRIVRHTPPLTIAPIVGMLMGNTQESRHIKFTLVLGFLNWHVV